MINRSKIKIMQEAYIVAGYRTAIRKSKKGGFSFTRPDDLAIDVIKGLLASVPQLDLKRVDDVIVGNAVPEAEQGLQVGRIIAAGSWYSCAGHYDQPLLCQRTGKYCNGNGKDQDRHGGMYHCRRNRKYEHGANSRMENVACLFYCQRRT